jgi:uncharacterized protein (DUF488 family)
MDETARPHLCLYTIGHSNQPLAQFVALLEQHRVKAVLDCRSYPRSRYALQFNREALAKQLPQYGIDYVYAGRELGGRPAGADFYDGGGHVIYARLAESSEFQKGIDRAEAFARSGRTALMCSEEDPLHCHRYLLISRVLTDRGHEVLHIRGDGTVQTETNLEQASSQPSASAQLALFEQQPEKPQGAAWRSTRSVLPKDAPRRSLRR